MAADANPILEALIDDLAGRLHDVDAVQRVQGNLDLVHAEIGENAALYAEAAAQLAQARRSLMEVAFNAAAARRALEDQEPPEGLVLPPLEDDPEVKAHFAAYVEAAARVEVILRNRLPLVEALVFLLLARALAFAFSRVHFLPRVLVTVAAAYALAYVVSWGSVVPGPTSVLWIVVLVFCFLFGLPVVGNLP